MRYFLFRIMIGAGLIKLKSGDKKWKYPHFSSMDYFYETQPVPNPLTKYFHFMPRMWHKFEVLSNHFIELIVPFGMILPGVGRNIRVYGGLLQILFQMVLISSGNLSFLNWLTLVSLCSFIYVTMKLIRHLKKISYQLYFALMTFFYQNIFHFLLTVR